MKVDPNILSCADERNPPWLGGQPFHRSDQQQCNVSIICDPLGLMLVGLDFNIARSPSNVKHDSSNASDVRHSCPRIQLEKKNSQGKSVHLIKMALNKGFFHA